MGDRLSRLLTKEGRKARLEKLERGRCGAAMVAMREKDRLSAEDSADTPTTLPAPPGQPDKPVAQRTFGGILFRTNPLAIELDHYEWDVRVSEDGGETWHPVDGSPFEGGRAIMCLTRQHG